MNYVLIMAVMFTSVLLADECFRRKNSALKVLVKLIVSYAVIAGIILLGGAYSSEMREFLQSMIIWLNGAIFIAGAGERLNDDNDDDDENEEVRT